MCASFISTLFIHLARLSLRCRAACILKLHRLVHLSSSTFTDLDDQASRRHHALKNILSTQWRVAFCTVRYSTPTAAGDLTVSLSPVNEYLRHVSTLSL
jgi:hypothetical protein